MLIVNLLLFLASLFVLIKSAERAVNYSSKIARVFHLSEFIVSFFIVAVISAFPEGTISIISALKGVPEFGLGTLLGSNVADLALVFGIVALFSHKGITVKSEILKNNLFYLILLSVPLLLGFDGHFSRIDGILLVLSGLIFFMTLSIESKLFRKTYNGVKNHEWLLNLLLLIVSMVVLFFAANYTVQFGVDFANDIKLPPFLIALTVVAIGTCLPELVFSLNAVRTRHNELAMGDILGTVIIDATVLVGVIALINPFSFAPTIIYVTGGLMLLSSILLTIFIKTGRVLSKKEGIFLLLFYILTLIIEFIVNRAF